MPLDFWGIKSALTQKFLQKESENAALHYQDVSLVLALSLFANPQPVTAQAPTYRRQAQFGGHHAGNFTTPGKVNTLLPLSDGSVLAGGQLSRLARRQLRTVWHV
jgi:hypothetical protein